MGCASSQPAHSPAPKADKDAPLGRSVSGRLRFTSEVLDDKPTNGYNKSAKPARPLLKATSYVGTDLMTLSKRHPDLLPVAFMLGACTANALSARALKLDCSRIARILEQVEAALVKLGSQAPKLGRLDDLQVILDDTMKVLQQLKHPQTIRVVDPAVANIAQNGLLGKLRDRLSAFVASLSESAWVAEGELGQMNSAVFKQSAAVASAMVSVGLSSDSDWTSPVTVTAVIAVEDLLDASNAMCAPDALLDEATVQVLQEVPHDAPLFEFDELGPQAATTSTAVTVLQPAVMQSQVSQMCAMMESGLGPKAVWEKWPLDMDEAERLKVINELRLTELASQVDVSDVTEELQVGLRTVYVAAYIVGWQSNHLIHCRVDGALMGQPAGSVLTQRGRVQARKFSLCQHTVHGSSKLVQVPIDKVSECFDPTMFSNTALCELDAGVADQAARLANPGSDPLLDEFLAMVKKGAELMAAGAPIQHVGTCLRVRGQKVGTLCLLHPRDAWTEASEALLDRATHIIASRLEATAIAQGYGAPTGRKSLSGGMRPSLAGNAPLGRLSQGGGAGGNTGMRHSGGQVVFSPQLVRSASGSLRGGPSH